MSKKTPKQSSSSSEPWSAAQPYLKDLFAQGQTATQNLSNADISGIQLSAPVNSNQTQAQQGALNTANQIAAEQPNSLNALNKGLNATDVNNNPALQGAIDAAGRPLIRNFQRSILPQISVNALQNSGYGSSRQGIAEGIATSDLNQQLTDQASTMTSDAYNKGQDTMMRSLALAPSIYQNMLMPSSIQQGVGAEQQAQQQQLLTDQLTKWNFDRTKQMDALQQYAQLLSLSSGGSSTTTQSGNTGGASSILGGAAAGASIGSNFGPWGTAIGGGIGAIGGLF